MKNSIVIADINNKDNVTAISNMKITGEKASIKSAKFKAPAKNTQVNLLNSFAEFIGQMNAIEFTGRASIILPESVALRLMGAVKVAKSGGDVADKLYLDWMKSIAGYSEAIDAVAEQLYAFLSDEENSLNIVNARQLYRYELQGNIENLKAGDTIQLVNSTNEELGVSCTENNFLNGTYTVNTQTIKDRAGNTRIRAFVNRMYKVTTNGEQKSFTASELLTFMNQNPKADIAGNSDATNSAIMALKLRTINAELLPRTVVAKIQKVEVAKDGSLF